MINRERLLSNAKSVLTRIDERLSDNTALEIVFAVAIPELLGQLESLERSLADVPVKQGLIPHARYPVIMYFDTLEAADEAQREISAAMPETVTRRVK